MSIIQAVIGAVVSSGSGGGSNKSAALTSTYFEPLNEGQQQTIGINFTNWDGSAAYWTVTSSGGYPIGGQVDQDSGTLYPGTGNSYYTFNFTFANDATTEGPVSYYIRLGSTVHGNEYFNEGPKTVRDSSQTPALVLDVDPASISTPMYGLSSWTNTVGDPLAISNGSKSSDNGGTLVFNGTSTYVSDAGYNFLTNATYGTITLSAWIKPTAVVTGSTQTIIAKELCYKIIIANDGRIAWMTAKGYNPWEITAYADPGLVTAGAWAQVVATVDANYTRIYINGVKVTETTGNIIGANTNQFDIGSYNNTNDLFAGSMGEIKVWNYAITESTVLAQYNSTASRYGLSPLPSSLDFPGTGNPYLLVSNRQSDWNLGSTYTIEFWSKGGNASNGAIRTVASQGPGNGIDIGYTSTHLLFRNSEPQYPEPTPGVWTHVAFVNDGEYVNLYYNGVYQTNFNPNGGLIDGGSDLNIGRRAGVNGQGFYGKLAMLRISTTAKYTENFDPSNSYGVESDTRLILGRDPLTNLTLYELNGITTSASGGNPIYFSKATYPDLNNQIQAGNTVVDATTAETSTVTGAVFTPDGDPDNWGIHVSPGQPYGTKNFSGPAHPVSVQGAVGISTDFPNFQSLVFNQPEGDYLSTPASSDWNLGTTYTIEFWIKANNASGANIHIPGGQWGLINQTGWYGGMQANSILIGLALNKLTIAQDPNNAIEFAEPTAGVWTHLAFVNNGGGSAQKVYYNGVEQTKVSGSYQSNGWTNTTADLYIGRLAPNYVSHFDGKMAMVRISNTAKYLAPFTATTTYGVEADTKLFLGKLNPVVDSKSHTMNITGVTTSTDFPVVPASITITNVSTSRNPGAVTTVDFTGNVSVPTTGTIFFAWDSQTSGPYTLTVNPGSNVYTSPGLGLFSTGHDLTTQITIASGPNACTSNIFTSSWDVICLVEGTMITMADGSHKAIEEIKYTDLIRVWNFDLGEFSEALPIFVKREETYAKHYRFTFSDGTVLRTVGHQVFNKQAGEFTMLIRDTTPVGTITFNELGDEVTLISKEIIEESVKFYNVWTQYHLNLFADGILTSNRFNNIYPIWDMKFVKNNRALRPLEEFAGIDPRYISGLRLQEQPAHYSAEYIRDYVENKLERLDINLVSTQ